MTRSLTGKVALVNNASVFAFASLEQTADEQLHKMLDTNLWGSPE
jgi:NAD(P)-dependent dehydrogenase (short-subunit alcohol dehydrogenase family)